MTRNSLAYESIRTTLLFILCMGFVPGVCLIATVGCGQETKTLTRGEATSSIPPTSRPQEGTAPPPPKATEAADQYNPLQADISKVKFIDTQVIDASRSRTIPIRIFLSTPSKGHLPVILFSHGLGGNRTHCNYLAKHWSARGYICVWVQHPGSDDQLWKNIPRRQRFKALRKAANLENFRLRVGDISAVLTQLEAWNQDPNHSLHDRIDPNRIGMSGHSFGAVTTQAVTGQHFLGKPRFQDKRIRAAIALSPSASNSEDPKKAFASITIPWMAMTGTRDVSPIGRATVKSRMAVYKALPEGNKYQIVLDGGAHSAFTELQGIGRPPKNPNHHKVILSFSTAFWDAFLKGDASAQQWLDAAKRPSILEPADQFDRK